MDRMQRREKLSKPKKCPGAIYNIMLECWRLDVDKRIESERIVDVLRSFCTNELSMDPEALRDIEWPDVSTASDDAAIPGYIQDSMAIDLKSASAEDAFRALEIDADELSIGTQLGKGQFGSVHKAIMRRDSGIVDVAVKKMIVTDASIIESEQFEYEARLLACLHHRNIVHVLAVRFSCAPLMIVLELMSGGDLKTYLTKRAAELEDEFNVLTAVCQQIADAMVYLEQNRVIHRDLAARFDLQHST